MKTKFNFLIAVALVSTLSAVNAQQSNNQGVTIGMDLQPILQMDIAVISGVFDELAAIPTIYILLKDKEFVCEKQELTEEEVGIQNSDGYERM